MEPTLAGEIVGYGLYRTSPQDFPALRRRPGPVPEGWPRAPLPFLRYSDEQTVTATAAVFTAIEATGQPADRFASWGVVAASRYLGRANLAAALRSFQAEGVWGTSPHLIPHFALHSPAGTISLVLGLHGPNLGVGGGLHAAAEGFLTALTWLAGGVVPGVWLVLSGWSPELVPEDGGGLPAQGECQALALALVDSTSGAGAGAGAGPAEDRPGLRNRPGIRVVARDCSAAAEAPIDLVELAVSLETPCEPSLRTIATDPQGRLRVELVAGLTE
jgi:hypothetical protein